MGILMQGMCASAQQQARSVHRWCQDTEMYSGDGHTKQEVATRDTPRKITFGLQDS